MHEISIDTTKEEDVIDITKDVNAIIQKSGIAEGLCLVYTMHTTAAIIINENWDPNIGKDVLNSLSRIVPKNAGYEHDKVDGNAHSHIKSTIMGPSETLIFRDSKLVLGKWQSVMFCEFDGPRKDRKIAVELIPK